MSALSIPTYDLNMMRIGHHKRGQSSISKFDLECPLFDLEGKNSKFRCIPFLRMVTKNISMRFQHPPMKTVGGVRENA